MGGTAAAEQHCHLISQEAWLVFALFIWSVREVVSLSVC